MSLLGCFLDVKSLSEYGKKHTHPNIHTHTHIDGNTFTHTHTYTHRGIATHSLWLYNISIKF